MLKGLGDCVTVTRSDGEIIASGESVAIPARSARKRAASELNIFLHISKTAGTSLRNTLLSAVPAGEQLLIYPGTPGIPVQRFHQIPLRQRSELRWIFGHCKFGLDRFVTQPSRYVTFVREPQDRLRSNFAHHAAAGTEFDIDGERVAAATVINEGLSEEFDNVVTRVIAGLGKEHVPLGCMGADEVALAMVNVRRHFLFVGQHSRMDADTATLRTHLGLPGAR